MIYFGATKDVPAYFASIGHEIPEGYNPADFLIDVLFLSCTCDGTSKTTKSIEEEEKEATGEYAEKADTAVKTPPRANKKKAGSDEIELVRQRTSPALAQAQEEQQKQQQQSTEQIGSPLRLAPSSPPRIVRLDILEAKSPSRERSNMWVSQEYRKRRTRMVFSLHSYNLSFCQTYNSQTGGVDPSASMVPWQDSNPFAQAFKQSARFKAFTTELDNLLM